MQRHGLAAGNVTETVLRRTIFAAMQDVKSHTIAHVAPGNRLSSSPAPSSSTGTDGYAIFTWGGMFHRLPENYVLTRTSTGTRASQFRTAEHVYLRWHLPDASSGKNISPLKLVAGKAFSIRNQRKRFSDWKKAVQGLEKLLEPRWLTNNALVLADNPTPAQYRRQFQVALHNHYLRVRCLHRSVRKRRYCRSFEASLRVSTVLNDMRSVEKTLKRIRARIRFIHLQRIIRFRYA